VEAAQGRAGRESLVDRLRRGPVDPVSFARPVQADVGPPAGRRARSWRPGLVSGISSSVANASAQRILVGPGPARFTLAALITEAA
jgi:hypothetical protein